MRRHTSLAEGKFMSLPSRRQVTGAGTTRRVFLIYAAVSLLPVLLLGAGLLALTTRQATARGLAEGAAEARLAARVSVAPDLRDRPLSAPLSSGEQRSLNRTVDQAARNGVMLRVRVRDLGGRVVYSPDQSGVGSFDEEAAEA